jgi:hypothetical protein
LADLILLSVICRFRPPLRPSFFKAGAASFEILLGPSENNRRAKYYRRTKAGERQLGVETEQWTTISRAIGHALKTT